MPEKLATAAGADIGLDEAETEFARAMAAPGPESPEIAAPPAIDPEAPHGRTKDGRPKRGPGGRPAKPRTQAAQGGASGPTAAPPVPNYTVALSEAVDGLWAAGALIPAEAVQAQAALLKSNKGNLVMGLNMAAQNNVYARWAVEKMSGGQVTWVLLAAMALAPPVLQSLALWKGDEALEGMGLPGREALAATARAELRDMMVEAAAAMTAEAQAAMAAEAQAAEAEAA